MATAFKSVCISISVSLLVRARGAPRSGPCGPVERGFVAVSLALETRVPTAGGVGLCQSYLPRLADLLNTSRQLSSKPLGDRNGQSCQPFWHGVRGHTGRSIFWVHCDPSPPQVHIFNQLCIGSLMRCGFIGSLFILFTLYTSFLSCPPVFMSGHLILSFVGTHMSPGLRVYVHNLLQPRFQVAQVFIIRRVFIGCPCALGSLSSQPHTPLSRLVPMSSFFCLVARALTPLP